MQQIELIKIDGQPTSIAVGPYVFPIKDGKLEHNQTILLGSLGDRTGYDEAYKECETALELGIFDKVVDN